MTTITKKEDKTFYFPISINNEEDWSYWGEAKFYDGCFSDWKTIEEFWNNMSEAIQSYSESINEWFFEKPNTWILKVNFDKNGKVKSNSLKRFNEDSYKILSWS